MAELPLEFRNRNIEEIGIEAAILAEKNNPRCRGIEYRGGRKNE
jgi:hypothetical protein